MLERLGDRDPGQFLERRIAERPAGGRQHQAGDLHAFLAAEQLVDRVVLAVDRQQRRPGRARRRRDELPRQHQQLLARQGDVLARAQRREGGGEPGGADDRGHHGVHLGQAGDLGQAGGALQDAHTREGARRAGLGGGGGIRQRDGLHLEFLHRADQVAPTRVRRQPGHAQQRRMRPRDREGGRADGAGGPEDGDGPRFHARLGRLEATAPPRLGKPLPRSVASFPASPLDTGAGSASLGVMATQPQDLTGLSHLGNTQNKPQQTLETFPNRNAGRNYTVELSTEEFTCLCPATGQPDFAKITIRYVPGPRIVESKSLKLYFWSYRQQGVFHEHLTNKILDDLVAALDPVWCEVTGAFGVRGGIGITVRAEHGKKPQA